MRRTGRPVLLLVALTVFVAACTGSGAPPATEASASSSTTTITSSVPPTTSTTAQEAPEAPPLADPFDLAEGALVDVPGYESQPAPVPPSQLTRLELALDVYSIAEAIVWDQLESETGDEVFVASVYPYGMGRGDPTLPPFVARLLSEFDEEPEEIPIEHGFVYATAWPDSQWMAWGSNTVLIVTAGPREAALEVVEALAAANQDEYLWQPGDCLWLGTGKSLDIAPYSPFGRGPVVPCDGWHTHEVIGAFELPDGPDAPYPADTLLNKAWWTCEEQFLEYVGIPEQDSSVGTIRYQPSDLEWEEGDRYLACLVMEFDAAGEAAPRDAPLAGIGEASRLVRHPGECRRGSPVSQPIPCEAPHDGEYLGTTELTAEPDAPFPENVYLLADIACRRLLDDAVAVPDGAALDAIGLPPGPLAWSGGDRRVPCTGFVVDEDGIPQLVIGSITEEGWRVVGPVGDDVTV